MIDMLSMDSLLCWRPRYTRLEDSLNNQLIHTNNNINKANNNINIIKNIGCVRPVEASEVVDATTSTSAWYLPQVSRCKAEEILATSSPGAFLLRASSSPSSAFALSVRVEEERVQHHLLLLAPRGVSLHGSSKVFPSLGSLVTHLSIMQESLPCTLTLAPRGVEEEEEEEEDIVDIDSDKEMEDCVNNLKMRLEE